MSSRCCCFERSRLTGLSSRSTGLPLIHISGDITIPCPALITCRNKSQIPSMHLGQHWPGSLTGCWPAGQGLPVGTAGTLCWRCCTWLNSDGFDPESKKGLFPLGERDCKPVLWWERSALARWTGHCCTEQRTSPSLQLQAVHASSVHEAPSCQHCKSSLLPITLNTRLVVLYMGFGVSLRVRPKTIWI